MNQLHLIWMVVLLPCCASIKYSSVKQGAFKGKAILEWDGPNEFVYRPDPKRPLEFIRSDGEVIKPNAMYTDAGSIPQPLWAIKNYSPLGYAPAFLIHDWLFDAHHCQVDGYEYHTIDSSADVMSECIKTLMETRDDVSVSKTTLYAMDKAVRSPFAKKAWDSGRCKIPPAEIQVEIYSFTERTKALTKSENRIQVIDFD